MFAQKPLIAILVIFLGIVTVAMAQSDPLVMPSGLQEALNVVRGDRLLSHVKILASDEFEGRAPGTRGEDLTVKYVIDQFKAAGTTPGNPNGSYAQIVPLVGYKTIPTIDLIVQGKRIDLKFPDDFVHDYPRLSQDVVVKSAGVVFAGYGITAPQFGWDDYKNLDVRGKLVIVLSGEPSRPKVDNQNELDPAFFKGVGRTYYGTREFKYAQGEQNGAAGVLIIYDPDASSTYSLFQTFAKIEGQNLRLPRGSHPLAIAGLVTTGAVRRIFDAAGHDFAAFEKAAQVPGSRTRLINAKANISLRTKLRKINSRNVVAKVAGSDPLLSDEYVIYTAHWDHLGKDTSLKGDQIYNGANDNATGVAQLIEAARAFAALKEKPARSILFLATTAEEKGYLGARYFLQNPLYPRSQMVANINLDAGNPFGLTRDLASTGYGNSTLDGVLQMSAEMQGRVFVPGSLDETGSLYFGSDQIEFAKAGIPAVFPWSGNTYVGRPPEYGGGKWDEYGTKRYHQVSDEVMADWEMSGAVEDTRWFVIAGYLVAQNHERPKLNEGSEFQWTSRK
jgi:Zn-dependent M28 family amino/carboxypeptidase